MREVSRGHSTVICGKGRTITNPKNINAVQIDLSKYFDTLNHELLMNMVREQVHDKRVTELIKKYLKKRGHGRRSAGENERVRRREDRSVRCSQIYLNEFYQEMSGRDVPVIRYADDIVVLAKSERAADRLLKSGRKYLEGKLKLRINAEKSKVVSVAAIRNFKFLAEMAISFEPMYGILILI